MRKTLVIIAIALAVFGMGGYTAGLFTVEAAQPESCGICRATRFSGTRYGFRYERIEDSPLTVWFRQNLDPEHGRTEAHAHTWKPSGCPVYATPGAGDLEATCPSIAPVFLLKPETELSALQAASDNRTRRGLIDALNVPDRRVALERVKLLVEYVYVHQEHVSWSDWWTRNCTSFGLRVSGRPVALLR